MKAHPGDKVVISGHRVGESRRVGVVKEVRRDDGAPPYRVEWDGTGHSTLLFPGPDCAIESAGESTNENEADR